MKPLTPIGSPSPLRLLNKGPDYLRRQMDGGGRYRAVSAVERLEADKAKYVKSQQVINTKQEPILVPCATPPPLPRRPLTVPGASTSSSTTPRLSPRRLPAAPYSSPGQLAPRDRDENENEENDAKKENRRVAGLDVEERNRSNVNKAGLTAFTTPTKTTATTPLPLVAPHSAPVLRRSTGKRMMRPDSLLIYRQKKECKTPNGGGGGGGGVTNGEMKGYSFVRRLFQGSMREKSGGVEGGSPKMVIREERMPSRDEDSRMSWTNESGQESRRAERKSTCAPERTKNEAHLNGNANGNANGNINGNVIQDCGDPWEPVVPRRGSGFGGLRRSKSDLRLRCSLAVSEQERFFDFCGLDLDLVERLGPQNFLSGASSVDTLSLVLRSVSGGGVGVGGGGGVGSEASEFSRRSGEGLFQEELTEQLPSGVSIIERNARVIKWLYSCKNAVHEGPKESTV